MTGFHAAIGEAKTTGFAPAAATVRPVGPTPDRNGLPAEVTTGCETLPKLMPCPAWHES